MMQRLVAMDPGIAGMVDKFTLPFFITQLVAAFATGISGGAMAVRLIVRHFAVERVRP
jgi:hypothetical protein